MLHSVFYLLKKYREVLIGSINRGERPQGRAQLLAKGGAYWSRAASAGTGSGSGNLRILADSGGFWGILGNFGDFGARNWKILQIPAKLRRNFGKISSKLKIQ